MNDDERSLRSALTSGWQAVLVGVVVCTLAISASAAGTTAVVLDGPDESIERGETASIDVVVENADGGVGAYNLTASVANVTAAEIVGVEPRGSPVLSDVDLAPDGSRATVTAALMNTSDDGSVTIATVRVEGTAPGSSVVTLAVPTLGDEEGQRYTTDTIQDTTVEVVGDGPSSPNGGSASSGNDDESTSNDDDSGTATPTGTPTVIETPDGTASTDVPAVTATSTEGPPTAGAAVTPPGGTSTGSGQPQVGGIPPTMVLVVVGIAVLGSGLLIRRRL